MNVYSFPGYFGSFEWSSSDGHIVYIAEKKQPKTCSYFSRKSEKLEEDTKKDETVKVSWQETDCSK